MTIFIVYLRLALRFLLLSIHVKGEVAELSLQTAHSLTKLLAQLRQAPILQLQVRYDLLLVGNLLCTLRLLQIEL